MLKAEIQQWLQGKKCVVTGGTGMIGRHVVKILKDSGAIVKSVSMDDLSPEEGVEYKKVDLRYFDRAVEEFKNCDIAFLVAGIKGSVEITKSRPASFCVPLIQFITNSLEACRINGVRKAVYVSSIGAYGGGYTILKEMYDTKDSIPMDLSPGYAKRMGELQIECYAKEYGLDYSIVRPSAVYGEADNFDPQNAMFIPALMAKIKRGDDPVDVWGDGSAIRDFLYAGDCAKGIIHAAFYGTNGFVNLAGDTNYSIKNVVETMSSIVPFNYKFNSTGNAGASQRVMDITKAEIEMRWKPDTCLRDGLVKTWNWFSNNSEEQKKRKNYFAEG